MENELNVLLFLTPKSELKIMDSHYSVRQGLQVMRQYGYSALPVVNRENGLYCGSISEGDFLNAIVDLQGYKDIKDLENIALIDIVNHDKYKAVNCNTTLNELVEIIMNQNFVSVVDDRGCFMGIVTRKRVIEYYYKVANEVPKMIFNDYVYSLTD